MHFRGSMPQAMVHRVALFSDLCAADAKRDRLLQTAAPRRMRLLRLRMAQQENRRQDLEHRCGAEVSNRRGGCAIAGCLRMGLRRCGQQISGRIANPIAVDGPREEVRCGLPRRENLRGTLGRVQRRHIQRAKRKMRLSRNDRCWWQHFGDT